MPDLAQKVETGEIFDARTLALSEEEIPGPWQCPGCHVEMFPVACGKEGKFKVSPYFRAERAHELDCAYDGLRVISKRGRIRPVRGRISTPEAIPSILRLASRRPQLPNSAKQEFEATDSVSNSNQHNSDALSTRLSHASTASSLHRVAEVFCGYPDERDHDLSVRDCEGHSYRTCFQRLGHSNGYKALPQKILYCPISFRRHDTKEHSDLMEIVLNAAVWPEWDDKLYEDDKKKRAVIEPYKIVLPIQNWSRRTRVAFIDIFEAMRQEQKNIIDEESAQGWNVYAFFLAKQIKSDLSKFEVSDHRLITFLIVKDDDLPMIAAPPRAKSSRPGLRKKPFIRFSKH